MGCHIRNGIPTCGGSTSEAARPHVRPWRKRQNDPARPPPPPPPRGRPEVISEVIAVFEVITKSEGTPNQYRIGTGREKHCGPPSRSASPPPSKSASPPPSKSAHRPTSPPAPERRSQSLTGCRSWYPGDDARAHGVNRHLGGWRSSSKRLRGANGTLQWAP